MTVLWLVCYLFSGCPDFVHDRIYFAWGITLAVCFAVDVAESILK